MIQKLSKMLTIHFSIVIGIWIVLWFAFAIYYWELLNPFLWLTYIKTWCGLARLCFFIAVVAWWWFQLYCIWEIINNRKSPLDS